jgi:cytoskeletal protein CcmA (bactofilin family)
VDGEIRAATVLIVSGGSVSGTIVATEVIVEGDAVDALIFADRIVLRHSAYVTGEIWHRELVLEAGHMFEGKSRRHDDPRSLAPTEPQHFEDHVGQDDAD